VHSLVFDRLVSLSLTIQTGVLRNNDKLNSLSNLNLAQDRKALNVRV
jgi:hypothetical protein